MNETIKLQQNTALAFSNNVLESKSKSIEQTPQTKLD